MIPGILASVRILGRIPLVVIVSAVCLQANAQVANAPVAVRESEFAPSALTAAERVRAEQWGLDETQWQRYRALMGGIRGAVSAPTISPLEVLGIHARSEAERRHFAEQWARMMHDDATRILSFQRAYDAAWQRLFGESRLFEIADASPLLPPLDAAPLSAGDRVLFFTKLECEVCDKALRAMLSRLAAIPGVGLDIFVTGDDVTDDAIRSWAKARRVPLERVQRREITLNRDSGTLARLAGDNARLPHVLRRRNGVLAVILDPVTLR